MKGKEKLLLLIIAAIVTIIIVTSCSRQFCQKNYPCIDRDSTSIIQTANIDTIYIPMPADTVKLETQIDCPDQKIIYKDGKVEYKVVIKDKILTVYRISDQDSLRVITAYKNTSEYKKLTEIKEVEKIVTKTPKLAWYSYLLNVLLIVWLTRKFWIRIIAKIKI